MPAENLTETNLRVRLRSAT